MNELLKNAIAKMIESASAKSLPVSDIREKLTDLGFKNLGNAGGFINMVENLGFKLVKANRGFRFTL